MPSEAEQIGAQQIQPVLDMLSHDTYNGPLVAMLKLISVKSEGVSVDSNGFLKPQKGKAKATIVFELDVHETMLNPSGNVHGGCTAFLLDTISSFPLLALSDGHVWQTTGVSSHFDVHFLVGIPRGAKLRITTSTLSYGSRRAVMNCKFEDRASGTLYAYGTHSKADPYKGPKL